MENLEWHPVFYKGLETNVEVTRCGRVRRVKVDWLISTYKKFKIGEQKFTNLKNGYQGYKSIGIQILNSKYITVRVHQLIAATFLGYEFGNNNKLVVDHIDSNKLNNNVNNLQLLTNNQNAFKEKSFKSFKKQNIFFSKTVKSYICQIKDNDTYKYIGMFKDKNEAINHYNNKLKEISIHKNS
jgi:hypothetical protein